MKIAVIGGAGVRTVIFINGLLARYKALHIDEVALYDINQEKQQIITKLCRHVVNRNHKDLIVTESADVRKVLQDADYVVTTLRVGNRTGNDRCRWIFDGSAHDSDFTGVLQAD